MSTTRQVSGIADAGTWDRARAADRVVLDAGDRVRRRIVLTTEKGKRLLLDFPEPMMLRDGDGLVLDDGSEDPVVREQRGRLLAAASSRGVRVETVETDAPSEVARYASLLLSGTYASRYLRLGLVEE